MIKRKYKNVENTSELESALHEKIFWETVQNNILWLKQE